MDNFLSQEEIDALLNQNNELEETIELKNDQDDNNKENSSLNLLSDTEKDALGEIGNISMGSASTTLSEILQQKVVITTPRIRIIKAHELYDSFNIPYLLIDVNFTEGLDGSNILVIKTTDAAVIADLMMGGTGENPAEELNDIHVSAVAEAMNQMIGSAATSMATIFGTSVKIAPPIVNIVDFGQDDDIYYPWDKKEAITVISFDLKVGELIDSEIMQVMPVEIAQREAELLLNPPQVTPDVKLQEQSDKEQMVEEPEEVTITPNNGRSDNNGEVNDNSVLPKNLNLILDIPLKVSVILGKTKKPIQDLLRLTSGSIVELDKLANEPVDILVNGTLIAKGEVVVINENYGVRVTNIISPEQRLNYISQ
jgi:flagellar motor switch protein FliN/FliY